MISVHGNSVHFPGIVASTRFVAAGFILHDFVGLVPAQREGPHSTALNQLKCLHWVDWVELVYMWCIWWCNSSWIQRFWNFKFLSYTRIHGLSIHKLWHLAAIYCAILLVATLCDKFFMVKKWFSMSEFWSFYLYLYCLILSEANLVHLLNLLYLQKLI